MLTNECNASSGEADEDGGAASEVRVPMAGSGIENWASRYVGGEGASKETETTHVPACI